MISSSEKFFNTELVVATTSDEFYDLILRRFTAKFCPSREEFHGIFDALVKVIAGVSEEARRVQKRRAA